ncbi:flagellar motor switch protein FliN [Desulfohalobiaceae bacterium Ax17]|uniref:flagellar motor switch protein FliN n=1 Tax=Desulfovulcanus ferrireducens TaxID=2831190 RepID=UPI00207B98E7|nr:flagellar motor switch protein FliN [Desulfovulcanus ferrireducens]MBT8763638.1 flagellar motor switch protein FliN [Desulfovulcanus ferrireducens]
MADEEKKEMTDQEKLAEEWAAALGEENIDLAGEDQEAGEETSSSEQEDLAEEWAKALASEEEEKIKDEEKRKSLAAQSKEAQFKDLTAEARAKKERPKRDLEFILDIPLTVTAQLGSTQLLINELLQLGQGSVIELNKLAGEPLEVLVNGKLVARGEAVVINEKFGVRLTDIISPIERIKQLG